jgi:hypothetical protein
LPAAIRPDLAANIAAAIPGGLAAAGAALEAAGPAAELLLANPATAGAAAVLGLGALAYYAYNHASASSEPPVQPSTSDEPEKDKSERESRFRGDNLGPAMDGPPNDPDKPPAAAPAVPPTDSGTEDSPKVRETVRPTDAELQRLVDEHSDPKGLPLTMPAARTIVDATQPEGTNATIVGKNVQGSDVFYTDANGNGVTGVQVKTASNLDAAEAAVRQDLRSEEPSPIIALEIPADTSIPRLLGKLQKNFRDYDTSRTSVFAVDPSGNVLIELQPFPK